MKIALFSTHKFEKPFLQKANQDRFELLFLEARLTSETASLARDCDAVSLFVNDDASAPVLDKLSSFGIKYIVLRSAGYNNVDLKKAKERGMQIARVPAYSPYAVAEHAVALMLALNRKIVHAHNRVLEGNFALDGLTGFDMHGKTAGIIGTGKIGAVVAKILNGFGCRLLAYDLYPNTELSSKYDLQYTDFETICRESDIITLHTPLTPETKYLINEHCIELMKPGVMLINTSRGGLVNTRHVVKALKNGKVGYLGLDVYEDEQALFFSDHSGEILQDDVIARLMSFRNVLITSHQGFLTQTALQNIADTTLANISAFDNGDPCLNLVI